MNEEDGVTCVHVSSSAVDVDKTLARLKNPEHWACHRMLVTPTLIDFFRMWNNGKCVVLFAMWQ